MPQTSFVIAVTDDDAAQRYATSRVLERAGFAVVQCSNGQEALAAAAEHPDLVVLDIRLPDIDGIEVCRRLKADPNTATIPILHLSAQVITVTGKVSGLEAGADAYLTQPVEPDELIATVKALLRAKTAEDQLRASERRYRMLFEAVPLPCWVINPKTCRFLAINDEAVSKYGYAREELMRLSLIELRHPDERSALIADMGKFSEEARSFTTRHVKRDGSVFHVEVTSQDVSLYGEPSRLQIIYDLTERNAVHEARQAEEIRRAVLQKVIAAQEDERRRVARELHDEAGQALTSILVGLRNLERAATLDEARDRARSLRDLTSANIEGISRLARGLHPPILEDLGLEPALERLASEFQEAHGVKVNLIGSRNVFEEVDSSVKLGLYRVAQEALTNIAKHAQATEVAIRYGCRDGTLSLEIADNGVGYDPRAVDAKGRLGLQGISERALMLGGKAEFSSSQGQGARVCLTIPLCASHDPTRLAAG